MNDELNKFLEGGLKQGEYDYVSLYWHNPCSEMVLEYNKEMFERITALIKYCKKTDPVFKKPKPFKL